MDTIDVTCPACFSGPGKKCTQPTDNGRRAVNWFHLSREDAARQWAEDAKARIKMTETSREAAVAVLWWFRPEAPGGLQPGSFVESLIHTITRADIENTVRLARGFPELVRAVEMARNEPDGLEVLQRIANP